MLANAANLLQETENRQNWNGGLIDSGSHMLIEGPRNILIKTAAGDVRYRLDRYLTHQFQHRLHINLGRSQQALAQRTAQLGIEALHCFLGSEVKDLANQ